MVYIISELKRTSVMNIVEENVDKNIEDLVEISWRISLAHNIFSKRP